MFLEGVISINLGHKGGGGGGEKKMKKTSYEEGGHHILQELPVEFHQPPLHH